MTAGVEVPELVRQRAAARGKLGARWLDGLPEVVEVLTERWGLRAGGSYAGGTAGLVVAATDSSDRQCVLKIAMVHDATDQRDFAAAVRTHELAAGRGCAALMAYDFDTSAMVLERLGPNLAERGMPLAQVLDTIAATLHTFWRPVDQSESVLRTGADKAAWLARFILDRWERLDQPCDRAVIDRAMTYCDRRGAAFDPRASVLVHGDAHGWNTVAAGDGFKLVDPEGLISEPAHDLSVALREYNEPLLHGDTARLVWQRAERLAHLGGVEVEPVWEWGFIERVSTGLANLKDFDDDEGHAFLEVARRCL